MLKDGNLSLHMDTWSVRQHIDGLEQPQLVLGVIILVGVGTALLEYALAVVSGTPLSGNAADVWQPFAETVLGGGEPYVDQWDNKPPLFQLVNVAAAATGAYRLAFMLFIGVANATTAALLYRWCRQSGVEKAGVLAAFAYLAGVYLFGGATEINPRQFAVPLLVAAFLTRNSIARGVLIAGAGLFTQYAVFVLPVVLYEEWLRGWLTARRVAAFAASGLATVAAAYGAIALIWQPDTAVTAVQYTFFASSEYVGGYSSRGDTFWSNPTRWTYYTAIHGVRLLPFSLFGVAAGFWAVGDRSEEALLVKVALAAAIFAVLPSMIRPVEWYYLPAVPFLAVAGALGIVAYVRQDPVQ